jgi:hypothetical protein
MKTLTVLF